MGMRVGSSGSSAAMAAWHAQSATAQAAAATPAPAAAKAGAAQGVAQQQVAAGLNALASGSSVSKMA